MSDSDPQAHFGYIFEQLSARGLAFVEDPGIVRNRAKIEAIINNARRAQELIREEGSLAAFVWRFEPRDRGARKGPAASTSAESMALSKQLKNAAGNLSVRRLSTRSCRRWA